MMLVVDGLCPSETHSFRNMRLPHALDCTSEFLGWQHWWSCCWPDHASDSSYKLAQNLKATSSHDDHGGSEKGAPITLVTILCNSGQRHLSKF
ncbi:hypothetical protein PSHT_01701 [Puccinia striiformis]|uniref:Uncharacterized protein n=1 Tax=Puccinia striiformis TaxID=27350 RepID=A0A2S4WK01_9BASI|nr:hypothetical protein PSHT_01701 [Puccinia striiformis]